MIFMVFKDGNVNTTTESVLYSLDCTNVKNYVIRIPAGIKPVYSRQICVPLQGNLSVLIIM